jgi:tetratricopeptide (TPR) repeat protein
MSRLEAVRNLLEQDPANSRVRFMLAMEYASAGQRTEALREFEELAARDPDYVALYYQAGRAAEDNGDLAAARTWYQRGIEAANRTGDRHAASELQAALDLL